MSNRFICFCCFKYSAH